MKVFSGAIAFCVLCGLPGISHTLEAQSAHAPKTTGNPEAQELNHLLSDAQDAIDRQDYPAAAENYRDYLEKKPDDATVHYDLGYLYTAMKRPEDAESEYEKAVALKPDMAPAWQNLGLTLLSTDPSAAVTPLQKASELSPADARMKWLLGAALEGSGKLGPAIDQYQAAENLDGKNSEFQASLGHALLAAGRTSEAETAFRAALTLNDADTTALAQAHLGLAHVLIAEKKPEDGASELAAYLEVRPNDTPVRLERAFLLIDMGKDDDALSELDRAATAGPEGLRALELRARIYTEKKQYDAALPVLQKASALAPHDPAMPAQLGRIYLQKKDYLDAAKWLATAFNMDTSDTGLLSEVIAAEYLNKNYAQTLDALDELSRRRMLTTESLYIRASCYDNLNQEFQALDAYKNFLELNTDENNDMYFAATARVRTLTRELADKKR